MGLFHPIKEPLSFNFHSPQNLFHSHPSRLDLCLCRATQSQAMQPTESTELHYLLASNQNHQYPTNLDAFQFSRLSYNPLHHHLQMVNPHVQDFILQPPCFSSNSTSDEADEQQLNLINERKQRRMISNRESARRSRMRKQKHLDELWSQVVSLRNENHQLLDKLNHVTERHDQAVQENVQLKEEATELRHMLTEMQLIDCPFPGSCLKDIDHI